MNIKHEGLTQALVSKNTRKPRYSKPLFPSDSFLKYWLPTGALHFGVFQLPDDHSYFALSVGAGDRTRTILTSAKLLYRINVRAKRP